MAEHGREGDGRSRIRGFGLRVSQGGSKTFILLHGPRRTRTTLGRYPLLSLSKAREKAGIILAEITLGIEPEAPTIAFGDALAIFFASHCAPRTGRVRFTRRSGF